MSCLCENIPTLDVEKRPVLQVMLWYYDTAALQCTGVGLIAFETGVVVAGSSGDNPIHFCVTTKWLDLGHQFNHLPTCVHFSPSSQFDHW